MDFFNLVGVLGGLLYMLSYALLNTGRIIGHGYAYIGLNLAGASCMAVSLYVHWNGPSFAVQICWIAISAVGIFKRYQAARRQAKQRAQAAPSLDELPPHLNA